MYTSIMYTSQLKYSHINCDITIPKYLYQFIIHRILVYPSYMASLYLGILVVDCPSMIEKPH